MSRNKKCCDIAPYQPEKYASLKKKRPDLNYMHCAPYAHCTDHTLSMQIRFYLNKFSYKFIIAYSSERSYTFQSQWKIVWMKMIALRANQAKSSWVAQKNLLVRTLSIIKSVHIKRTFSPTKKSICFLN